MLVIIDPVFFNILVIQPFPTLNSLSSTSLRLLFHPSDVSDVLNFFRKIAPLSP